MSAGKSAKSPLFSQSGTILGTPMDTAAIAREAAVNFVSASIGVALQQRFAGSYAPAVIGIVSRIQRLQFSGNASKPCPDLEIGTKL